MPLTVAEKRRMLELHRKREGTAVAVAEPEPEDTGGGFLSTLGAFLKHPFVGAGGTIESGILNPAQFFQQDPVVAAKRVGGGLAAGATLGAVAPFAEDVEGSTSGQVAELLGTFAPFGAVSKFVGGIKGVGGLTRGLMTGASLAGVEQGARSAVGKDVSLGQAAGTTAIFGALDGFLHGLGSFGKKLSKMRDVTKIQKELSGAVERGEIKAMSDSEVKTLSKAIVHGESKASLALPANERFLGQSGLGGASNQPRLYAPAITRGEEKVLHQIPQITERGTIDRYVTQPNFIETGPRMHRRLGTTELMLNPIHKAENDAARHIKDTSDEFNKLIKDNIKFGHRGPASRNIMIYATAQQKGGAKILGQMGIKETPTLTANEQKIYGWMRERLEGYYTALNQARLAGGLKPFPKVQNYFTFFRSMNGELKNGFDMRTLDIPNTMRRRIPRIEETPFRYKKPRVTDDYGELELDAFSVFERYSQSALRHIELTPQVQRVRQMLDPVGGKFKSGFNLLEENPEAYRDLNSWVNFVAGVDERLLAASVEKQLGKTNENLAYAVLGYNIRSAFIQPTAIVNSLVEIGPKYTMQGINAMFNKEERAFARRMSDHLAGREHDVALNELMTSVTGSTAQIKKKVGRGGLKPLQLLDMQTAVASWLGAYKKGRAVEKLGETKAARYADDIVIRTQASASRSDVAPIQRSKTGKFVAMFQTFVINNWGFLTRDVLGLGNVSVNNKQAMAKVVRLIAGVTAVNTLYEDILGVRSPFPAPINAYRKEIAKSGESGKAIGQAILELAEVVPVVGGGMRYGSSPLGAGIQLTEDLAELVRGKQKAAKAAETIGKLTGMPGTTQIKKTIRFLKKPKE